MHFHKILLVASAACCSLAPSRASQLEVTPIPAWQRTTPELVNCKRGDCVRMAWVARVWGRDWVTASPWNGRFQRYSPNQPGRRGDDLLLVAVPGGKVIVTGNTSLDGLANLVDNTLVYDVDACHVDMTMKGKRLLVKRGDCGDRHNDVTGEYRQRHGKPKAKGIKPSSAASALRK